MKKQIDYDVKISKTLSYILRHGAIKEGLQISSDGYVKLSDILSKPQFKHYNEEKINEIVKNNDKKRFEIANKLDGTYIRAAQGHSIQEVENNELLVPVVSSEEFPILIHGTYLSKWEFIKTQGLKKMNRNHIHLATGLQNETTVVSGMRSNCNIYIFIDLEMAMKDGIKFFKSSNNVVLTEGINGVLSPKYFKCVQTKNQKTIYTNSEGEIKIINQEESKLQQQVEIKKEFYPIDYLLVLDFEAQCEENVNLPIQEIIEFPVIPIDMKSKQIMKDKIFHYYIKPTVVPILTKFCTDLTGIQQSQVDSGISIIEALSKLNQYLMQNNFLQSNFAFITCGNWDLSICLANECKAKSIVIPEYLQRWINIKDVFWKFRKLQPQPPKKRGRFDMVEMLEFFELNLDGRHHSGIDDSKNIAKIALKLINLIDFSFLKPQEYQNNFLIQKK